PHWQFTDNFSWTHGSHTTKFGGNVAFHGVNLLPPTQTAGTASFTDTSQGPTSGYGMADLLLGLPTSTSLVPNPIWYRVRVWDYSVYLQDDYKVSSRLTLNLGLRWELNPAPTSPDHIQTSFDQNKGIPFQEGTNGYGNRVYKTDKGLLGPRLGFSWQA